LKVHIEHEVFLSASQKVPAYLVPLKNIFSAELRGRTLYANFNPETCAGGLR
jgi:hypothetical protein